MKTALFLAAIAFAPLAHAIQVGDSVTYSLTANGQTHELMDTVIAISGDNVQIQASLDGTASPATPFTTTVTAINELGNDYANCTQMGGQIDTVTVAAGTFKACHISQSGQELYFTSEVPFGILKMVSAQFTMELKVFVQH
jgi:hypothetical protein